MVTKVRGEGVVFGIECGPVGHRHPDDVANALVEDAYLGREEGDGVHLLGPLAGNVVRISPPLTITKEETADSLEILFEACERVAAEVAAET